LETVVFEDEVDFYTNGSYGFHFNVFWGCSKLSSVTLPKDTPGYFYIPMGTFGYCSSLKSIEFPANTRRIEQQAFYRSGLESLDLTTIECEPFYLHGLYTFAACENLKTITANGKLWFDGLYTFQDCKALETVTFSRRNDDDYTVVTPDVFRYCDNLKSVEFYRLKGISQAFTTNEMDSVFTGCKNLESVTSVCPPEVSKIGYSCFDGCESLKTLTLPQQEFVISMTAFRGCAALESFDFENVTSIGIGSFSGCTALATTPNISKLTTITENAFKDCTSLTNLEFTDLTSIGSNAFNGCTALASFSINSTSTSEDPVSFAIGSNAFKGCTALASVNFNYSSETSTPPTITSSIGSLAFTGCSALASLNFNSSAYDPPTVDSEDAFDAEHYTTTKVNMPEDRYRDFAGDAIWSKFVLKHPEMYAYEEVVPGSGSYSITKGKFALDEDFAGLVEIPATYNSGDVVAIKAEAFKGLTGITGITLPEGLTSIGAEAFAGCENIATVQNKAIEPISGDNCPEDVFDSEVYSNGTLTVPFGSLDAYSSTAPWANFKEKKQGFGERILAAPTASPESGDFNWSFDLTLTKPEDTEGTIYYYVVSEGDEDNAVHPTFPFTSPITIPAKNSKVWAYITDDTNCSEPISFDYNYVRLATEVGLDKVLSANADDRYFIDTNLYGHYHDGTYLYASTMGNSGSSKNTFNADKKTEWWSDKEDDFNQEDWVAISGLSDEYVGKQIERGSVATVGPNTDFPV
ncbi:MAG: leucine-rich repeat protein, partial [Muribaculaceae bacterium]